MEEKLNNLSNNYEDFILELHNIVPGDNSGVIEKGCCVSSFRKMPTDWRDKQKSVKWECGYHKAFILPLLEYCTAQVVHPINLQNLQKNILKEEQKKNIIKIFMSNLESCPVCRRLCKEPDVLKTYYRLPNNSGTIIERNLKLDSEIIESDIKLEEPILIDITGYRGTGLYVLHKNGFSPVNRFEYYPVWQLHLNYITPKVINSFYDSTEGFKINDSITICIYGNDKKYIIKNINDATIISYQNTYQYNKEKLLKLVNKKPVLINFNNSKLFLQKTNKEIVKGSAYFRDDITEIYVASFYDESENTNFYFLNE